LTVANRDAGNWGDVLAVDAPEDAGSVAEPVRACHAPGTPISAGRCSMTWTTSAT